MKYDRRSVTQRNQYELLSKCWYECKGKNSCDLYTPLKNGNCVWYETLLKDEKKIGTKEFMTFSILEVILQNDKNSK